MERDAHLERESHEANAGSSGGRAPLSRRSLLKAGALAAGGMGALGALPSVAGAAQAASPGLSGYEGLYAAVGIYTTASYWIGPKAALKKAEQVWPGVKTEFTGVPGGDDSALISVVEQVLTKKPRGLMLEPADPVSMQSVIKAAAKQGIPTITVNCKYLPTGAEVGYVGFSRYDQGAVVAETLVPFLKGKKGRVLGQVFSLSAPAMVDVFAGFKDKMKALRPDITVQEVNDAGDIANGTTLVSELLSSHKDIIGIGGLDTASGQIAANAVKATKRSDVVIIAGAIDEAQTQYWPLIKSGVVKAGVLSSSFLQFWEATQSLVNLNAKVALGLNWQKSQKLSVVPVQSTLGSFVIDNSNLASVTGIKF
jgi:ribose transport system substrate-binding protein